MNKFEGTNLLDFKEELLKDAKTLEEYERLKPKYQFIQVLIDRRHKLGISQERLAQITGTKQPAISRLETGDYNTTLNTFFKVANALNLDISFKTRTKTNRVRNKITV